MASMTMAAAAFLGCACPAASTFSKPSVSSRGAVLVKASRFTQGENDVEVKVSNNGRRELVFAAAAACSIANVAMADDEPKRGTPDAKKKYSPVCVTMPTARICHE